MKVYLADENATRQFGVLLGQTLNQGSVILLQGELGAGKTTLVQGIGAGLGLEEAIVSPTFSLISEYGGGRTPLYHLDLYRLEPEEVAGLYLETYWEGVEIPMGMMVIEWAEHLPYLPESYLKIELTYTEPGRWAKLTTCKFDFEPQLAIVLQSFYPEQ